jgi:hypothetical protein
MRNIRIPVTVIAVLLATLVSRKLGSIKRTRWIGLRTEYALETDHRVFIVKE